MTIDMATAKRLYSAANDQGLGYAPYTDEAGDDTVDEAVAAAQRADGWELVLPRRHSDEVAVLRNADGEYMAIGGDAMGNGAWACTIEPEA